MKKPFKKRFDYSRIGFIWAWPPIVRKHFVGTVSTYKWGWKKKAKPDPVQQQTIKEILD
jgi:hypothetical protein